MATWLDILIKETYEHYCPSYKIDKGPNIDDSTVKKDEITKDVIGCRGLTCEQCWNQESEE